MLGFSEDEVAYFIAFIGILSCIAQVSARCIWLTREMRDSVLFRRFFWQLYKSILVPRKRLCLDCSFKLYN